MTGSAAPLLPRGRTCRESGRDRGGPRPALRTIARRRAGARLRRPGCLAYGAHARQAYARQARISSRASSGKSARIWSSDIPPARYPRTSPTVMRVPRSEGLPNRTSGVIAMRSRGFKRQVYATVRQQTRTRTRRSLLLQRRHRVDACRPQGGQRRSRAARDDDDEEAGAVRRWIVGT